MPVLDHFFLSSSDKGHVMCCKHCTKVYQWKAGNGTGSLKQHMESQHASKFTQQRDAADDSASSVISTLTPAKRSAATASSDSAASASLTKPDSKKPRQTLLFSSFKPLHNAQLPVALARFFAQNHIAYNVASSDSWLELVDVLRNSDAPVSQRKGVRKHISDLESDMRAQLLLTLQRSASPIALAIDGWTNVKHTKVLNIVLICENKAYYWRSIPNALEKNSEKISLMSARSAAKRSSAISCFTAS